MPLDIERLMPRATSDRGKWSDTAEQMCRALYAGGDDTAAFALTDCLRELGWTFAGGVWAAREVMRQRAADEAKAFPARLRELIDGAGLSVSAAARDLGVTRATLYNLLNGTHAPTWPLVQRIADRFRVTTDSLRESPE